MEKHVIGIDVDKNTFKVCFMIQSYEGTKKIKGSKIFKNNNEGFVAFKNWVKEKINEAGSQVHYVMEATGTYHEQLAYYLNGLAGIVHIVLPLKSKHYLKSLGVRSKTDKIDAKGLAMMGCEQQLERWQPASADLLKLRSLTRQVEALQNHRTSFKNQLEGASHLAVVHKGVIKSLLKMIKELEKQIIKLEDEIKQIIKQDEVLNERFALLGPLKGVGLMTFAVIAAETDGFALFNNQRQLVCYAGYDVLQNQSGQKSGKTRISKKGNSHIRRILHMASLSTITAKTEPFYNLYERVYERSKIKMKGYVAVQRKLLVMIYTIWKKSEVFDPEYNNEQNERRKKTATNKSVAALDELPVRKSSFVI